MTTDEALFVRSQAKQLKVDFYSLPYNVVYGTEWAVYIKGEQFSEFDDAVKNMYGGING